MFLPVTKDISTIRKIKSWKNHGRIEDCVAVEHSKTLTNAPLATRVLHRALSLTMHVGQVYILQVLWFCKRLGYHHLFIENLHIGRFDIPTGTCFNMKNWGKLHSLPQYKMILNGIYLKKYLVRFTCIRFLWICRWMSYPFYVIRRICEKKQVTLYNSDNYIF